MHKWFYINLGKRREEVCILIDKNSQGKWFIFIAHNTILEDGGFILRTGWSFPKERANR